MSTLTRTKIRPGVRRVRRKRQPDSESHSTGGLSMPAHASPQAQSLQRLPAAQQRELAAQYGQAGGNQALQHMLTGLQPGNGAVQRLTTLEKAQDLKSPRFARDPDLEKAFDNDPPLVRGAHNDGVAKVQQALIEDGFDMPISTKKTGSPDGIFGRETKATVKAFQVKYGLLEKGVADGKVGRHTMGKLDELYSSPVTPPKTTPDIDATDKAMGEHVVEDVHKINDPSSYTNATGVWYSHVYRAAHNSDPQNYPWDDDFENGFANPKYFVRIAPLDWVLRPGVSASEGIKAWLDGLTIAECNSALVAVEIDTLRAAVGDAKFDENFGSTQKVLPAEQRLRIKVGTDDTPVAKFIVSTKADEGTFGNRPAEVGEWLYFYNHPKYLLKHPGGAFQGENAVYMGRNAAGEQLWAGLGVSDTTEKDMLVTMADDAYNPERDFEDYKALARGYLYDTPEMKLPNPDYAALYTKYIDRIPDKYRHDKNSYPDTIKWEDILTAEEYKLGDTTRKGGFVPGGAKLDAAKVQDLRNQ